MIKRQRPTDLTSSLSHLFTDKNKRTPPPCASIAKCLSRLSVGEQQTHTPGIGQYNFLAGPRRRCALALLHGHKVADIGQHRLQVRHFVSISSPPGCCCCCFVSTHTDTHSLNHNISDGRRTRTITTMLVCTRAATSHRFSLNTAATLLHNNCVGGIERGGSLAHYTFGWLKLFFFFGGGRSHRVEHQLSLPSHGR